MVRKYYADGAARETGDTEKRFPPLTTARSGRTAASIAQAQARTAAEFAVRGKDVGALYCIALYRTAAPASGAPINIVSGKARACIPARRRPHSCMN